MAAVFVPGEDGGGHGDEDRGRVSGNEDGDTDDASDDGPLPPRPPQPLTVSLEDVGVLGGDLHGEAPGCVLCGDSRTLKQWYQRDEQLLACRMCFIHVSLARLPPSAQQLAARRHLRAAGALCGQCGQTPKRLFNHDFGRCCYSCKRALTSATQHRTLASVYALLNRRKLLPTQCSHCGVAGSPRFYVVRAALLCYACYQHLRSTDTLPSIQRRRRRATRPLPPRRCICCLSTSATRWFGTTDVRCNACYQYFKLHRRDRWLGGLPVEPPGSVIRGDDMLAKHMESSS